MVRLISGLFIFVFFFSHASAYAQNSVIQNVPITSIPDNRNVDFPTTRQQSAQNIQQIKQDFKQEIAEARTALKESNAERKAAFQQRLANINDNQKRVAVQNIDQRISAINDNQTSKMSEHLSRLSSIADKLTTKLNAMQEQEDVSAMEQALEEAKDAIADAMETVRAQAAKDYNLNITSETTLRQTILPIVNQFKQDIRNTFQSVVEARLQVAEAARLINNSPQQEEQGV